MLSQRSSFDSLDIQTPAELIQKRIYRLLFICEKDVKDVIACCAYAETISLLVISGNDFITC
jgi:hypothetical protein